MLLGGRSRKKGLMDQKEMLNLGWGPGSYPESPWARGKAAEICIHLHTFACAYFLS